MGRVGIFKLRDRDTGCVREWKQNQTKSQACQTSRPSRRLKKKLKNKGGYLTYAQRMTYMKDSVASLEKLRMS